MTVLEKIKSGFTILDGGMGTELQKQGLAPGELPENWNITNPDAVINVHRAYFAAGSDVVAANTFGANSLKFGDRLEDVVSAGIANAKKAAMEFSATKPRFVALDVGPLGKMLSPWGDLPYDQAIEIFARTVRAGVKAGADLILIETMNDAYETKAAVLAAKENSNLPIFVTNVYDSRGQLLTGADPTTMVALLEGLRVDALGLNCSLGPKEMKGIVAKIIKAASIPVIVKPNAGLPTVRDGKTIFNVTPEEFAAEMSEIANMGAAIVGGCCGTNPQHIKALSQVVKTAEFKPATPKNNTVITSYNKAVTFGDRPILIGERINPTGKKRFKQALVENDMPYILNEGEKQAEAGVDALDVNVGLPEIDEADFMERAVSSIQEIINLPLQIDTALPAALEKGLRIYNGKPMINSVNGKQESMQAVFPLAAKYGGVVVALTLDEGGIPDKAEERVAIAERIISVAADYGISKKDIIVDPLALAVSADSNATIETLKAVKMLTERGIKTSLGVSNVSFGLPNRDFVTSTFFALALQSGLSAAIMNPYSLDMQKVYNSYMVLCGKDESCKNYIDFASKCTVETTTLTDTKPTVDTDGLYGAIIKGIKSEAAKITVKMLENTDPMTVINQYVIPALDEVGRGFEAKTVYLPQLLMSAEAATAAFDEVKTRIPKTDSANHKKIILATVRGDIHDIGKNIVKVLLENYGFNVIDLGRDVPCEKIVETAVAQKVGIVGLSALMTTTVPSMAETIKLLKKTCPDVKIVVGGAVMTKDYADEIGADCYGKTAMDTVRFAETFFGLE